MSSPSAAQLYAKRLQLSKNGYPLWVPEPVGHSDIYRTKGIRIGDVGYSTDDGMFRTLFNVRGAPDAPINCQGVPDGFERLDLDPSEITYIPTFHPPNSTITSEGVERPGVNEGPEVESTGPPFNGTSAEDAFLHLPDGASRISAPPERFKGVAQRGARSWYKFANTTLQSAVHNGSLFLVTGCDKTHKWILGNFSGSPGCKNQTSLQINAKSVAEDQIGFPYNWINRSYDNFRCGLQTPGSTNPPSTESAELLERDSFFNMDAPNMQTQAVFIRGYRILLRTPLFPSIGHTWVNINFIHSLWQNHRLAPINQARRAWLIPSSWLGKSRKSADIPESAASENNTGVVLELIPPYDTETVDLAQILNSIILQITPSADVSLVHDDEWGAFLPVLGEAPKVKSVEAQLKKAGMKIVVCDGCASLELTSRDQETDDIQPELPQESMIPCLCLPPVKLNRSRRSREGNLVAQETNVQNIYLRI